MGEVKREVGMKKGLGVLIKGTRLREEEGKASTSSSRRGSSSAKVSFVYMFALKMIIN